ncbi:PQQ-binding-like beta-propeller repeat protein [uncultured Rikenella sp.]|uniref:outer membrane protein assembly factor BamB family protein n=1 Tax=uncultured Rikenella sp. TaxID=368003 RepID=UPI002602E71D|nr:PQQ-binding-like beta-propeller repeat protein [uncultured Rikenella sp.]
MKKQCLLAIAVLLPALASAQLRGTVYLDGNGSGSRDASEKGLAGVSVSDGRNVVKTSADGSFELPDNPQARFVTVTTPSGYRPGDTHYRKVAPDKESYDFGLIKSGHAGAFEFIQITDTETPTPKEWLDDLKAYVAANPTAFIVHTGDICYAPGLSFHAANVRTRHMGVPTYYTIGNHDLLSGDYGEQRYEQLFGPAWCSFEVGNVHFLALPMLGGDHAPSYNLKQVLEWIRNDLAQTDPHKKVIMFNHDLWFQGDDVVIRAGGDSLDMKRHNLVAFIYGHWHSQYAREIGGVMTYCASTPDKGGIDHSPAGFRVFSVDADGNISDKTRTRYTHIPGLLTTTLPAQHDTIAAEGGLIPVRVNAYRTVSPTRSVRVAWVENGKRGRTVALVPQTDWSWSGTLAVGNRTGVQHLVAEATFADGTTWVEHRSFVLTDTPAAVAVGADWANLGGDAAHAGIAAGNAVDAPRYVWAQNAGGNIYMTSPVVGDGKVFVATIDDDNLKKCAVVAYDAATGRELWRFRTGNSVKGTMVYADGLVLACDAAMQLYAISANSGKVVWDRKLNRYALPENLHGLAVADGVVYAGQGGHFTALNVEDGSVVWKNEAWSGGEGTQSTTTVGEEVVLASSHWNGLFAHDRKDGRLLWKKQDAKIRFRDGSVTIYDGHIYLASRDELFLINPRSGDILKSAVQPGITFEGACAPVVTERMVYVGTADKGVVAFDRRSFKPVWTYATRPAIIYSVPYYQDFQNSVETSPVLIGGTLVFGASDGYLYGVDAENGRFRWKRNLGAPIFSSPAVSGNALYVADFSGTLYCLKINE